MAYRFSIWNQANDDATMAIRAADMEALHELAGSCTGPDVSGSWGSLKEYLNTAATATERPFPYTRMVDVVWLNKQPFGQPRLCQDRIFRVLYNGNQRVSGGFASQGYCILEPSWTAELLPLHREQISIQYLVGSSRDCIVVLQDAMTQVSVG